MNLKEYLFYAQMTVTQFADIANLDRTFVSSILSGGRRPSKPSMIAIERATGGQVTAQSISQPIKVPKHFTKVVPLPLPKPHPVEEDDPMEKFG